MGNNLSIKGYKKYIEDANKKLKRPLNKKEKQEEINDNWSRLIALKSKLS